jgi:hypothetical protein
MSDKFSNLEIIDSNRGIAAMQAPENYIRRRKQFRIINNHRWNK